MMHQCHGEAMPLGYHPTTDCRPDWCGMEATAAIDPNPPDEAADLLADWLDGWCDHEDGATHGARCCAWRDAAATVRSLASQFPAPAPAVPVEPGATAHGFTVDHAGELRTPPDSGILAARWLPAVTSPGDRGFQRTEAIQARNGGYVQVRESSLAEGPHLWIDVAEPVDINGFAVGRNTDLKEPSTIHLSAEAARELRDHLDYMLRTHYQGDEDPCIGSFALRRWGRLALWIEDADDAAALRAALDAPSPATEDGPHVEIIGPVDRPGMRYMEFWIDGNFACTAWWDEEHGLWGDTDPTPPAAPSPAEPEGLVERVAKAIKAADDAWMTKGGTQPPALTEEGARELARAALAAIAAGAPGSTGTGGAATDADEPGAWDGLLAASTPDEFWSDLAATPPVVPAPEADR